MGKHRRDSYLQPPGLRLSGYIILVSLLVLVIVVEALSVMEWAAYPYFPDKSLLFAKTDATIFDLLAPFSPALLVLLLYTWVPRLAVSFDNRFSKRLNNIFNQLAQSVSSLIPRVPPDSVNRITLTDRPRLLLVVAVVSAILLALVPYRPNLNPAMTPVGVDAHYYVEWVNQMLQLPPAGAFSYAIGNASYGSRPLILIPIYLVVSTGLVSTIRAVELLPAVLGPLVALSAFVFVREGQQSEKMAGVVSLFSVFSFYATVGMWAGFFANWLAVVEAYVFLTLLLRFLRSNSGSTFVLLTLMSLAMLLTHPWTGVVVLAVASVFVLSVWRDSRKIVLLKALVVLLSVSMVVYVTKSIFVEGLATAQYTSETISGSGVSQLFSFWPNIIYSLFVFFNGLFANAILLGLSIVAVIRLRFQDRFERLLALWVAIGSIPFPLLESGLQVRILYDLPFPVLASMGLLFLIRPVGNGTLHSNLALLLVLLLSANYALRMATNLVAAPF